ncbi:hypothetical protein [Streptomyces brasiliensis]|uniref:Agarase n=1 Tax=Streptomyces brasiliensis TaxID=1954 RepID=A0A917P821_9ACTN|nr:hypothetical protein [Streptomyces brasiliensis]GGJ65777.1 hypothetical protein GCM10010121_090610 [Streptomyces brasiliensis]
MISRRTLIGGLPAAALAAQLGTARLASAAQATTEAGTASDSWLVDRYGQYLHEDWAGKVVSDEQLRREYAEEAHRLADVVPDRVRYDRYGGLKALGRHRATGYFRLEQVDGRWWFVTPAGHLFFLKAVDAFSPQEWGYGTWYKDRAGTPLDLFEELPDPQRFASCYTYDDKGYVVSFLRANLARKYGDDYRPRWRRMMHKRMIDWGFNAQGKWTLDTEVVMPYIAQAPTPTDVVRISWGIDPFDPEFPAKLDRTFDLRGNRDDPWLIGYFFENERGWSRDVVAEVVTRDSTLAAKTAFVDHLADTYGGDLARVNALLNTTADSFRTLADTPLTLARVPSADVSAFITLASQAYFRQVREAIHRQDPNHLFLGGTLVPTWRTSPEWNVGGREYLDAISFDWYSTSVDYLRQYEGYGKPILNLEFSFMYPDRGMTAANQATTATSQRNRGELYRTFLEAQAASPAFVGSGWFSAYDQAVTRKPGATEAFNVGLTNQQDQPYHDMLDIMREVNRGIEAVHLQEPPA